MDRTMVSFKVELAKRKIKNGVNKVVDKTKSAVEWGLEHKEIVIPVIVAVGGTAKKAAGAHKVHEEQKERLTRFYDPRKRTYTYTKRIPKNKELLELERRYENGESYREILTDMNLV